MWSHRRQYPLLEQLGAQVTPMALQNMQGWTSQEARCLSNILG
jgi:hypothetical protein